MRDYKTFFLFMYFFLFLICVYISLEFNMCGYSITYSITAFVCRTYGKAYFLVIIYS